MKRRVLITCRQMQEVFSEFEDLFVSADLEVDLPPIPGQQFSAADLRPIISQYVGVIAGDDVFDKTVLETGTKLRVVSRWGVGMDSIDQVVAAELGIAVTNTPGMFNEEVADVTIAYVILLARQLHEIDQRVRQGEWHKPVGWSLGGKTMGVIGLGGIGQATARRGMVMGMRVVGFDPSEAARTNLAAAGGEPLSWLELLRQSDVLAINAPLNDETYHLIDDNALHQCRDGVYIVNTSRGSIIHQDALEQALTSGKVGGSALDVFEQEPLSQESKLAAMSNVILGSHNASNTHDAVMRASAAATHNLLTHLEVQR